MYSSDDEPPADGQRVRYDEDGGALVGTDAPIVPFVAGAGVGPAVVSAARRVLDAAAEEMGRTVHWLECSAGDAAGADGDASLPAATVEALERYRVGLVGPLAGGTQAGFGRSTRQRLGVDAAAATLSRLDWTPSPTAAGERLDAVCFSDRTADSAAGLEFSRASPAGRRLRDALDAELDDAGLDDGPGAFGVRPTTRAGTERVVARAVDYALERDRDRVTVVQQGDRLPGTEGRFRDWALDFLADEYGDATVTEEAFEESGGRYPEDEVVVDARHTDDVCRALLSRPDDLDVLVAPASAGEHVATVGSEVVGGAGVTPVATLGDGRLFAHPQHGSAPEGVETGEANPVAAIRAACLLFEALGWEDVTGVARDAVEATLADGVVTPDLAGRMTRSETVTTAAFADRVVDHVRSFPDDDVAGGVETTPEERAVIRGKIVGLYNAVFADQIRAEDVQLNQLRGDDEEADVYLPTVGINFRYWRDWAVERRLEVLLHEFAHVENYDDDHAPSFYDRLVELTEIAEDWQPELEALFDQPIDFAAVKRHVVESVHEETIDADADAVPDRKRALQRQFDLPPGDYY